MNLFEKLTPAETRRLASFLSSVAAPADSLTLMELRGFLFALCCAPAMIKPSGWMPEVFNHRQPNYASSEEEAFISLALVRLYNSIMAEVNDGTPQLPAACRYREPCEANFKPGAALHEWCAGFNQGYLMMYEQWESCVREDEELMAAVGYMVLTLGFFDDDEESRQMLGLAFDVDLPLKEMAPVVRSQMPQVMREFARIGRSLYEESIEEEQEAEEREQRARANVIPFRVPHRAEDALERRAQAGELVIEALGEEDLERRVALARKALSISEECPEAYMILAEDASDSIESTNQYYQQAMEAARRVLGEAPFETPENLWYMPEARPFLQAKLGHADSLWDMERRDEAIAQYGELLQLNPDDNQGVRYILLIRYLDVDDLGKAEDLLARYDEDSAWWDYTRALHAWIAGGDTPVSRRLRGQALKSNVHLPAYLSGARRMPRALPDHYAAGSANEAVCYAYEARNTWRAHAGAIEWLLQGVPERKTVRRAPAKATARKRAAESAVPAIKPVSSLGTSGVGDGGAKRKSRRRDSGETEPGQ
jgi:yecA family protein